MFKGCNRYETKFLCIVYYLKVEIVISHKYPTFKSVSYFPKHFLIYHYLHSIRDNTKYRCDILQYFQININNIFFYRSVNI